MKEVAHGPSKVNGQPETHTVIPELRRHVTNLSNEDKQPFKHTWVTLEILASIQS